MAVNQDYLPIEYVLNGSTTDFPVIWPFSHGDDLVITHHVEGSTPVEILNYEVTQTPDGGSVKISPALTGGTLRIERQTDLRQPNVLRNGGQFSPATIERMIDRPVMMVQELNHRTPVFHSLVAGAPLSYNGNGEIVSGDMEGSGDLTIRGDLAQTGADLIAFPDALAPTYLKTQSDINNGLPVSLHRFIKTSELSAIRSGATTYDAGDDIRTAFQSAAKGLYVPAGVHRYSGNLTRPSEQGLSIYGDGAKLSILSAVGAGGIVFNAGTVDNHYKEPTLDLRDLCFEAACGNAGNAVTMTATGGSGLAADGPHWRNVTFRAAQIGQFWNKAVRGTNIRDFHADRIMFAGAFNDDVWPGEYNMTHGFDMDGDSDPVELWFSNIYAFFVGQVVNVAGQYEGIYIDQAHTVACQHFLKWAATTPNPVAMVQDSYIATEHTGVDLDNVSYFRIMNNVFNPTAPVPQGNYQGMIVRRSAAQKAINASDITGNSFIGVGYSSTSAYTEEACHIVNADKVRWSNNTVYDMDVGITAEAGSKNIRCFDNDYINCGVAENVPQSCRAGQVQQPECGLRVTNSVTQSIPVNADTKLQWDTKGLDQIGAFNTAAGSWTPPYGTYNVTIAICCTTNVAAGDTVQLVLRKNGVPVYEVPASAAAGTGACILTAQVEANGTDVFEAWVWYAGSGSARTRAALTNRNYWHASLVR